jgi:hypothetical protein
VGRLESMWCHLFIRANSGLKILSLIAFLVVQTSLAQSSQAGAFSYFLPDGWKRIEKDGTVILTPASFDPDHWFTVTFASIPLNDSIENNGSSFKQYILDAKAQDEDITFKGNVESKSFCRDNLIAFFTSAWVTLSNKKTLVLSRGYLGIFTDESLEIVEIFMSDAETFNVNRNEIITLFNSMELAPQIAKDVGCEENDELKVYP